MAEIAARLTGEPLLMTHEDIVKQAADKVLEQVIPWDGYQKANLIEEKELELIKRYDKKSADVRLALIQKEGDIFAPLFMELLVKSSKEATLQYLLTLVDQLFKEYPESIKLFLRISSTENQQYPFTPFISLLQRSFLDWYTNSKASSILATLVSSSNLVNEESAAFMCHWIREQLRKHDERDICNALHALQKILVKDTFRTNFAKEDGIQLLGTLLKSRIGNTRTIQIVYQVLYCLWLLSYNKEVAVIISQTSIIPTLVEVIKIVQKEKGIRMALATLRNLLDISISNEQMIDSDIMKLLDNLSHKNWADDDVKEDLQTLQDNLQKNIVVLSSFDMYKREAMSGNLEWSPVHKSEKFWRENAHRLEEDNNKLLLVLKSLLAAEGGGKSTLVQAIACYDIGEFARHHPRGKIIVQKLGIKLPLMKLMEDSDPEVKKQALVAVQKLLVTNWEYLSK